MTMKKILLREFVAMDAGYKTPWIAKKALDDGKIPVMPYTRYKGKKGGYHPWDYKYDPAKDIFRLHCKALLSRTGLSVLLLKGIPPFQFLHFF